MDEDYKIKTSARLRGFGVLEWIRDFVKMLTPLCPLHLIETPSRPPSVDTRITSARRTF